LKTRSTTTTKNKEMTKDERKSINRVFIKSEIKVRAVLYFDPTYHGYCNTNTFENAINEK